MTIFAVFWPFRAPTTRWTANFDDFHWVPWIFSGNGHSSRESPLLIRQNGWFWAKIALFLYNKRDRCSYMVKSGDIWPNDAIFQSFTWISHDIDHIFSLFYLWILTSRPFTARMREGREVFLYDYRVNDTGMREHWDIYPSNNDDFNHCSHYFNYCKKICTTLKKFVRTIVL